MNNRITKINHHLCQPFRSIFDNLRYVKSYGEGYFLLSLFSTAACLGLVIYLYLTQPIGVFPLMKPDVAACTQLQSEFSSLSCEPTKIEQLYNARHKLDHLMRPDMSAKTSPILFALLLFFLMVAKISIILFRQAGFIEAHNKRKLGELPDPVKKWHGEPGRFERGMEATYNWIERNIKALTKSFMPIELPEPKALKIVINQTEHSSLMKLNEAMSTNVANPDFFADDLASAVGMSKNKLSPQLKTSLDCTPAEYMTWFRISLAQRLLVTDMPVREVKKKVGYKDSQSFNRNFKKLTGVLPKQYRKSRLAHPDNGER